MAEIRAPDMKEQAKQDYLNGMKYEDLAEKYDVSINTIKSWVKRYEWSKEKKQKGAHKTKKGAHKKSKAGAPIGNKNAVGHGAPGGNLNAIKHGAYQSIYSEFLSDEEKELYEKVTATINIDEEIRLLRLKTARLLNREVTFFYDMYGNKHEKEINEEDRENGILICMEQLRKLIETKASITGDTEKLQMDREKFEFNKYKDEIKLELEKEKLAMAKRKAGEDDKELHDDGFLEALGDTTEKVWDNYEEE